jgi:hypothetical protein
MTKLPWQNGVTPPAPVIILMGISDFFLDCQSHEGMLTIDQVPDAIFIEGGSVYMDTGQ